MERIDSLKETLAIYAPNVKKNVEIVSKEKLGQDYLLHISVDPKIKDFVPMVSQRTSKNEDRTVARVCTAPDIAGCILGYASDLNDFSNLEITKGVWNGGYYIYDIPFELALRPSWKLVYDVEFTNEHWLVAFDKQSVKYPAKIVGKLFYASVKTSRIEGGKYKRREIEMYVQIDKEGGINFNSKWHLDKGYWKVVAYGLHNVDHYEDQPEELSVSSISKGEFDSVKKLSADMLSHCEPASFHW